MKQTPNHLDAQYSSISISQMRVGTLLRAPIYDANSSQPILLLAAGARLTKSRLAQLQRRGISDVRVHSRDLAAIMRPEGESARPVLEDEERSTGAFNKSRDSFVHTVKEHGTAEYETEQLQQMSANYEEARGKVGDLFQALADETGVDGQVAVHVTTGALEELAEDMDLFVRLSIDRSGNGDLCNHGLKTARIAMAIGTVMGLKKNPLLELGIGCLIHDIGMAKVDPGLLGRKDHINTIEFLDITKHPIHTYDMLEEARDIPPGARMVAYQIHERWNGSGYPRQRRGSQIHPLARIGAVADAFAAMLSDRPHRPAMNARQAMAEILLDTKRGLYDPEAVRGLLQTISLFPIGSVVEVSDGRVGIVVRANHEDYSQPIAELWSNGNFDEPGEIVDLSKEPGLHVVRSIPSTDTRMAESSDLWELARRAELVVPNQMEPFSSSTT